VVGTAAAWLASQTINDLTKLVAQIGSVAAEQSRQLTQTQESLRKTLASIDSVKIDSTLTNVRAASASLEQLSRDLKETNLQVQGTITKVNIGNGTVGKLMNDPAVYARVDSLLAHMDSLILDIK
jgi:phospholipid/cholesterol/gamma-HCH transport system substrate-binding protein